MALIKMTEIGTGVSLLELAAATSWSLDIGAELRWIIFKGQSIFECRNFPDVVFWSSCTGLAAAHPVSLISLLVSMTRLLHMNGAVTFLLYVFSSLKRAWFLEIGLVFKRISVVAVLFSLLHSLSSFLCNAHNFLNCDV